ncbi:MAG: FGLLP motif-containing membrane protein [Candidatus Dormibacteria bacterium]
MRRKGRRYRGRVLPAIALALFALGLAATAEAATLPPLADPKSGVGSVSTISLGSKGVVTWCVATAPDGSVWTLGYGYPFTPGTHGSRLSHVLPDGSVRQFTIPYTVTYSQVQGLTVDTNGDVWFPAGTDIVRFDPSDDRWRAFAPPQDDGYDMALAAGAGGAVWFTEYHSNAVGMIDAAGTVHEFALPATFSAHGPNSIAVMPDGTVWVNAFNTIANAAGLLALEQLSPEGSVLRTYRIPKGSVTSLGAGPDGLPWFGYGAVPWGLGRVEPGGDVEDLPWTFFSEPTALVLGPDGQMWFAANSFDNAYGYYNLAKRIQMAFLEPDSRIADAESVAVGPAGTIALASRDPNLYLINTGTSLVGPSTIANSLPTPAEVFASATTLAVGGVISIGAILFLTFPSQLFNLTFQENYGEIREWWHRAIRRIVPFQYKRPASRAPARDWTAFAGVLLLGALAGSLLDPHFGISMSSAYTYVAIVLAICIGVAVPALVTAVYHRARHEDQTWRPHALVGGLAVAAVCVLVSRLTQFQPGYLYGVICGITFAAKLGRVQKGHIVALSTVATIVVAVAAWVIWVPVQGVATRSGASFALIILDDLLASVFVGGLVGTVIGLLPLRFLPGWDLRTWHQGAWLACFAFAVLAFVEVLLLPHNDNHSNAPLITTIVLLVVFGGLSIGTREWFARRRRRGGEEPRSFKERVEELLTPVETEASTAPEAQQSAAP